MRHGKKWAIALAAGDGGCSLGRGWMIRGFTLLDILVLLGTASVLMALLLPVVSGVRSQAAAVSCESNLQQLGLALSMYAQENQECMPSFWEKNPEILLPDGSGLDSMEGGNSCGWLIVLWREGYVRTTAVENHSRQGFLFCPGDDKTPVETTSVGKGGNPQLVQWSTYKPLLGFGWRVREPKDFAIKRGQRWGLIGLKRSEMPHNPPANWKIASGAIFPLLVEFPRTGSVMMVQTNDREWDFSKTPESTILSGPHANGVRSVLYSDYQVRQAYYAYKDPRYKGTKNDPFVWAAPGNPQ